MMTPQQKRTRTYVALCEMDKLPPTAQNRERVKALRTLAARHLGLQVVNFPSNP